MSFIFFEALCDKALCDKCFINKLNLIWLLSHIIWWQRWKILLQRHYISEPWSRKWARGEKLSDTIMQVDWNTIWTFNEINWDLMSRRYIRNAAQKVAEHFFLFHLCCLNKIKQELPPFVCCIFLCRVTFLYTGRNKKRFSLMAVISCLYWTQTLL